MREPDFSESQLQQAVNTAYTRYIVKQRGVWILPIVPSLRAEFNLGWDTAFYFDWLPSTELVDPEGCNFFLQYKLSGLLTTDKASEWKHWGKEFYRFKIPFITRNAAKEYVDDYHQWDRLKGLADKNYPTFYATNSTLQKQHLYLAWQEGRLLDMVPHLDVKKITGRHKSVTFTEDSEYFLLHSEEEQISKDNFTSLKNKLAEYPMTSLADSNKNLLRALKEIGGNDEIWSFDLNKVTEANFGPIPDSLRPWVKQRFFSSFIYKHIGATMLWFPKAD
ncbi:MAG: hypothetical protein NTW14_10990 [bacterium]|nr:hypothetical protein [bacterium]